MRTTIKYKLRGFPHVNTCTVDTMAPVTMVEAQHLAAAEREFVTADQVFIVATWLTDHPQNRNRT